MKILSETLKEKNVLLFDFGTLFIKSSVLENGEFNDYNAVIRNQIFYLSPEKAQRIMDDSKGEVKIDPGYYTLREIEDRKLLFQADPIYVQLDAIPKSAEILAKAYQNICEQTEVELGLERRITSNLKEWSVVIAIAAFETDEARKTVEDVHIQAVQILGFKNFYINTEFMFDYISQIYHMMDLGFLDG